MSDPVSKTLFPWLRANLGSRALAPLTSTDFVALQAAVQMIELHAFTERERVLEGFAAAVLCMQVHTRQLAFHAIAHSMDWHNREEIWDVAGLWEFSDFTPETRMRCKNEPTLL